MQTFIRTQLYRKMVLDFARHEFPSAQSRLFMTSSAFALAATRVSTGHNPRNYLNPYIVLQFCFSFSMSVTIIMSSASEPSKAQAPDQAHGSANEIRQEHEVDSSVQRPIHECF